MDFLTFLKDPAWDIPFFKKLPRNDTGDAPGHQGGLVVPIDLRAFFPTLTGSTTSIAPTIDYQIRAILYNGSDKLASVYTRYQFQTWGGTRSPESRLTGNLGPIRNLAEEGDLLLFQRHLENLNLYRFILLKMRSPYFREVSSSLPSGRWGTLFKETPISQQDINNLEEQEKEQETKPFALFEEEGRKIETRSIRLARSIIFRHTIQKIYLNKCVICNSGLMTPTGIHEVEASHIVPKSQCGSDDARNGLAFCKRHHWAFDRGLFGIDESYRMVVPGNVLAISCNRLLAEFAGKDISEPDNSNLKPDLSALRWHRENILIA